jgi:hypothetical protein
MGGVVGGWVGEVMCDGEGREGLLFGTKTTVAKQQGRYLFLYRGSQGKKGFRRVPHDGSFLLMDGIDY